MTFIFTISENHFWIYQRNTDSFLDLVKSAGKQQLSARGRVRRRTMIRRRSRRPRRRGSTKRWRAPCDAYQCQTCIYLWNEIFRTTGKWYRQVLFNDVTSSFAKAFDEFRVRKVTIIDPMALQLSKDYMPARRFARPTRVPVHIALPVRRPCV